MNKKDTFTTAVSVRMEEELRDDLEELAARDERPLANYTRKVLAEHVRDARERGVLATRQEAQPATA